MHTETDWLSRDDGEDSQKAYAHYMRVDADQREFLGPKEERWDELTQRTITFRQGRVGMTRGAKPENMRPVEIVLGFDGEPCWPHIRLDKAKQLQGWYQDLHNDKHNSRPRPCYTEALLTEPVGGWCHVGCSFCYLNSGFRGYRGSGLVTVPVKYGEQVRAQLSKMRTATAGYFSSFGDPFNPLERYYSNTQDAVREFTRVGLPVFFLTRLKYPGWAIDALKLNKYSYAQVSINTPDPDDWAKLSPNALPLEEHFDQLREMSRQGIYLSVQVNPIIAGITSHDDIEALIERLASIGVKHCIFKWVEAGYAWAPAMVERITKRFGDNRSAAFRDLFTENSCGGQKTIQREHRLEGLRRFAKKTVECGVTMSTCYEYDRGEDGKWRSIGADWLTGDQCHGQRVPVFTRRSTTSTTGKPVQFREVEACPPSGCLTCASDNGGEARCGNARMGEARAMRGADYREPVV